MQYEVEIHLYSGKIYKTTTRVPLIDIMGYIDKKETITIGSYGLRTKDIKQVVQIREWR